MALFRFTFPIINYYGDDIFEKHIYFERDSCPHHDEVVETLRRAHQEEVEFSKKHPERGPWIFEYRLCLDCIETIDSADKKLPYLLSTLQGTNTFCITKFGSQSISVQRIHPF